MAVLGKVEVWRWQRRMSNASWLWDLMNLQKVLSLCSGCKYKMPWHWERRLHYQEMRQFHGQGMCDGCRHEDSVSLFQSTDTVYFAQCERDRAFVRHAQARDREFTMNDRRRVRA
jgi:hypothetical protein